MHDRQLDGKRRTPTPYPPQSLFISSDVFGFLQKGIHFFSMSSPTNRSPPLEKVRTSCFEPIIDFFRRCVVFTCVLFESIAAVLGLCEICWWLIHSRARSKDPPLTHSGRACRPRRRRAGSGSANRRRCSSSRTRRRASGTRRPPRSRSTRAPSSPSRLMQVRCQLRGSCACGFCRVLVVRTKAL